MFSNYYAEEYLARDRQNQIAEEFKRYRMANQAKENVKANKFSLFGPRRKAIKSELAATR